MHFSIFFKAVLNNLLSLPVSWMYSYLSTQNFTKGPTETRKDLVLTKRFSNSPRRAIDHREGVAPHVHWCRRTCTKDRAVKIGFPPTSLVPPAEFVRDDLTCPPTPPSTASSGWGHHLWRMLCLINESAVMSSRWRSRQRSRCERNLHSAFSLQFGKTAPFANASWPQAKVRAVDPNSSSDSTCSIHWRWNTVWVQLLAEAVLYENDETH